MVYIYERLSQDVHAFKNPAPEPQRQFPALYEQRLPRPHARHRLHRGPARSERTESRAPRHRELVGHGFVDENAIGISGHSSGGYQIAYMVTQTSRFRAAEAGAPVGNMTSAYSGIRWAPACRVSSNTRKPRAGLGRPARRSAASRHRKLPVFHVQRINTPLLLLHR